MPRINPRYEEFFHERISNFLFLVYDLFIQVGASKLTEDILEVKLRQSFKYLTNEEYKEPSHNLSDNLLSYARFFLIIPILDSMYKNIDLEEHREKILNYALNLFITDCYTYRFADLKDLEI